MRLARLSSCLRGRFEPAGYVSFLSALVHHGALVDSLARVQIASPDRAGCLRSVRPGPADFVLIPRDLYFGWTVMHYEGDRVPLACPEKALLDWLYLSEERGLDPRLEEVEWEVLDPVVLDHLDRRAGLDLRSRLASSGIVGTPCHDQELLRQESLASLDLPVLR